MRWPMPRFFLGLVAAPLLLVSSSAFASGSPCATACNFVAEPSQCSLELEGGCQAQCTPLSLVAECDGNCNAMVDVSCQASCEGDCMTKCSVDPGSFSCSGQCDSDCEASCTSGCSDSACETDCQADCSNRCDVQCDATPPSASCETQCQASCTGSCTGSAYIDCHASCVVQEQGGCTAACEEPGVAIFCDGQFVTASEAASCVSCLEDNGFSASVSATCTGTQCVGSASVCSASPAIGASQERWGVFGITSLVVGLGLITSRRRRRAA